jgi:hypothetical protein
MSAQIIEERIIEERIQGKPAGAGRHQRPGVWQRVRQTVAEMNYASRRIVEVQARPGHGATR